MGTISSTIISPLVNSKDNEAIGKADEYEVFGFAPYWTINKLDNVDFNVLTTLAYFGVPVKSDGSLDHNDIGYKTFQSKKATDLFNKAHSHKTRVVLTLTQMDNDTIKEFLDDPDAQKKAIEESVSLVKSRKIDGINIDFEYVGKIDKPYRAKFAKYVKMTNDKLHQEIPGSQLSVSVYASSAKDSTKLYDIKALSDNSDKIFMMAYDFATTGSDHAIPTAPLYGYKEGKYWYDISSAVEDFLKVMPASKLIMGLPWYGYNYPVAEPGVKVAREDGYYYYYYYGKKRYRAYHKYPSNAQTYASAMKNITDEKSGWDDIGKVGWKAYQEDGIWRMIFLDDTRSLKLKYRFAKDMNLSGIGMWALGFDTGTSDMWSLLNSEFGIKVASKVTN